MLARFAIGLIGLLHVYILILEMFLWDKPQPAAFGHRSRARASKVWPPPSL